MDGKLETDSPYREVLEEAHRRAVSYLAGIAARHVGPKAQAVEALNRFHEPLPDDPRPALETLQLLDDVGSPATMATQGSRFFGLVVGGALPVTVGAQWLASAWDQIALSAATSPVAVELEVVASRWILDLLDLPRSSSVGFVTGTTMGNLCCLAAARNEILRRMNYDLHTKGLRMAPRLRIVVSDEIHVSVLKALSILGFGVDEIERVPTDGQGRLRIDWLPALDERTIVACQAGNVNSGAFDFFEEIASRSKPAHAWVHVDGAFGLWSRASKNARHLGAGLEHCDSWVTDTHKWLNTPWDCGLAICRDPGASRAALSTDAPYIALGDVYTPKDVVPEFGRRARGVEVWAALRTLGRSGLADLVDRCCRHAHRFAGGLRNMGLTVLNDVVLNQVVVAAPDTASTATLMETVQRDGECWIGPTTWKRQAAIRVSVSSWRTTDEDVERSLAAIERAWQSVRDR